MCKNFYSSFDGRTLLLRASQLRPARLFVAFWKSCRSLSASAAVIHRSDGEHEVAEHRKYDVLFAITAS